MYTNTKKQLEKYIIQDKSTPCKHKKAGLFLSSKREASAFMSFTSDVMKNTMTRK